MRKALYGVYERFEISILKNYDLSYGNFNENA